MPGAIARDRRKRIIEKLARRKLRHGDPIELHIDRVGFPAYQAPAGQDLDHNIQNDDRGAGIVDGRRKSAISGLGEIQDVVTYVAVMHAAAINLDGIKNERTGLVIRGDGAGDVGDGLSRRHEFTRTREIEHPAIVLFAECLHRRDIDRDDIPDGRRVHRVCVRWSQTIMHTRTKRTDIEWL